MKQIMTMGAFLAEVERREKMKKDLLVGPQSMLMVEDDESLAIANEETYSLNSIAHHQIADKFGIPGKYYDAMKAVPGLRAQNVNAWLGKSKEKHLVRTLDQTARAFLSDRFKPMDDFLILSSALPVLKEQEGLQIMASELSESRMYLQVAFPQLSAEVRVGEVVYAGITLLNSEVGWGSVDVRSWLLVKRCINGAVGESLLRQYHTGRRMGEDLTDYDIYSSETIEADLRAFGLKLRDILKNALTMAKFEEQVAKLRQAADDQLIPDAANVEKIVENVTKKYLLTKENGSSILAGLWKEGDLSKWGLANAVTALVHETKDTDQQYYLERTGFDIMNSLVPVQKMFTE